MKVDRFLKEFTGNEAHFSPLRNDENGNVQGENTVSKAAYSQPLSLIYSNDVQEITKSFKMKLKGRLEAVTAVCLLPSCLDDGIPDGLIVAGREDKILLVWRLSTGQEVCKLMEGHYEPVTCLTYIMKPNGDPYVVSGSDDGSAVVWNMKKLKSEKKLAGNGFGLTSIISFEVNPASTSSSSTSLDMRWTCVITAAKNGVATIWNIDTGTKVAVSEMEGESAFSSLAHFYKPGFPAPFWVSGGSETVGIWNMQGYILHVIHESAACLRVCYTSKKVDGEKGPVLVWMSSEGSSLSVMDLMTDKVFTKIENNGDPFGCMELFEASTGYQILVSCLNDILVYDMITGSQISNVKYEEGHTDDILDIRICNYGDKNYLLTGSEDNSLSVWFPVETGTTKPLLTIANPNTDGHTGLVTAVATCNTEVDGETCIVTASSDTTAIVWGLISGKQLRKLSNGHTRKITSAACFEPKVGNPVVFTAGVDLNIIKWDLTTGDILAKIGDLHQDSILSISLYSFDGMNPTTVSVGEDFAVGFFDWNKKVRDLLNDVHMSNINAVESMVVTISGVVTAVVITGSADRTARIIRNGVLNASSLVGHLSPIISVALLDVDTYQKLAFTASDDGVIMVWDVYTNALLRKLKSTQDGITSMSCYCQLGVDPNVGVAPGSSKGVRGATTQRKYPCIVTGSNDKTACIWDLVTGKRIRIFEGGHSREVSSVSVMVPKKTGIINLITAGYDNSATIWDLENCERAIPLEGQGHLEGIEATAMFGSKYNISADCNTIRVWAVTDYASYEKEYVRVNIRQPGAHTTNLLTMITYTVSDPTKKFPLIISSSYDGSVVLWDLDAQVVTSYRKPAKCPTAIVTCLCVYEDPVYGHPVVIGGGEEKEILVWSMKTGKILKEFPEFHSKTITQVLVCKFDDIGCVIITGSKDKTLAAWNYDKKTLIHKFLDQHKKAISCAVVYKPSSKVAHTSDAYWLVSCSYDKKCVVWDVKTGKKINRIFMENAHKEPVISILAVDCLSDKSKPVLVSGGSDGAIGLWDLHEGHLLFIQTQHNGPVTTLSTTSLLSSNNANGGHRNTTVVSNYVTMADLKGDFLASGGGDCNVCIWNLDNFVNYCTGLDKTTPPLVLTTSYQGCRRFGCSEMSVYVPIDGSEPVIVSVGDKTLRTTSFNTRKQITAPQDLIPKRLSTVSVISQGKPEALVGSTGGIVEIWNIKDLTVLSSYNICASLDTPKTAVLAVKAYSSIQREAYYGIAGLESKSAHVWNFDKNTPLCTLVGHKAPVRAVGIIADHSAPNGKIYAVTAGDDRMGIIWELPSGKKLCKLKDCHLKSITSLATYHNSEGEPMVITASLDTTAAIWHVMTGEKIRHLTEGHSSAITCVDTFVPSDQRSPIAITGSADRSIVVWHMRRGEKLRHFPDVSQEPVAAISIFSDLDGVSPIVIISDKKNNLQIRDLYPSTFMPNRDDVKRAFELDFAEVHAETVVDDESGPYGGGNKTSKKIGDEGSWSRIAKLSAKYQIGFWLEHGFLFMTAIEENRVDFLVKFKDMLKESLYSLRGVHSLLRVAIDKNSADCVQIVVDCWIACLPVACRDVGSQLFWHPCHFLSMNEVKLLGAEYPNICSELLCSLSLINSDPCTLVYMRHILTVDELENGAKSARPGSSRSTRRRGIGRVLPIDGSSHSREGSKNGSDHGSSKSAQNFALTQNAEVLELSDIKVEYATLGANRRLTTGIDNTLATKIPGMWAHFLSKIPNSTASGQPVIPQFLPLQGAASLEMLALFTEISDELDSPDIFDSQAGSLCLQFAWETVGAKTHFTMLISYVIFLMIYSVAIFGYESLRKGGHERVASIFQLLVLAQMGLYLSQQMLQLASTSKDMDLRGLVNFFAGNVWVVQDWISFGLVSTGILLRLIMDGETVKSSCILAIGSLFVWFKCLYYMRAYEGSGPLVAMVLRIAYDIRYFVLILALVLTGFAQAFWLISHHDAALDFGTLEGAFMNSYLYMLGNFSGDFSGTLNPSLGQFLLAMFMFFMAILMLNLLIALMGETFSSVSEKKLPQWRWEQAVIILEERRLFETLQGWRQWMSGCLTKSDRRSPHKKTHVDIHEDTFAVIHVLQYSGDVFRDEDGAASLSDVKDDIAAISNSVDTRLIAPLAKMEAKVDGIKEDFGSHLADLKSEMAELKALLLAVTASKK
jgi:WD40 repeat protein